MNKEINWESRVELCKSCKHSRPNTWERIQALLFRWGPKWMVCSRHSNGKTQLCINERLDYWGDWVDTCGEDAKYYEARK